MRKVAGALRRNGATSATATSMNRCCHVKSLVKTIAGIMIFSILVMLIGASMFSRRVARGASGWEGQSPVPRAPTKESSTKEEIEKGGRRLIQWLRSHGGYVGPLKVTTVKKGHAFIRGLVATADIPANTTLIRVPRKLFLLADDVDPHRYSKRRQLPTGSLSVFPSTSIFSLHASLPPSLPSSASLSEHTHTHTHHCPQANSSTQTFS